MSTIDQKRMLKLAGLLKEGVEEWPRGLAEESLTDKLEDKTATEADADFNDVPRADVEGDLDVPMGYAPGEDQDEKTKDYLYDIYSDMYKELNNIRPRWVRPEELSVKDLQMMIDELQDDINRSLEDDEAFKTPEGYEDEPLPPQDEFEFMNQDHDEWMDQLEDMYSEREIAELQPSAEEEEYERLPKQMGMSRGASLDEEGTYIDNLKSGKLEEAIRSIVREVLAEKKAKTYKGKSMRLGGGGRFAKFVDSLKKSGKSEEQARAIAYKAGVKKYGKGKMAKMAAAGKKRKKD
jgi:hypothetical protein